MVFEEAGVCLAEAKDEVEITLRSVVTGVKGSDFGKWNESMLDIVQV